MMTTREEIMQHALGLPPEDRALVAAALADSLTDDSRESSPGSADPIGRTIATGDEFLLELRRRSAALHAGQTTTRSATDVLADLLRRQVAETRS